MKRGKQSLLFFVVTPLLAILTACEVEPPPEKPEEIDALVIEGATLLDENADWLDQVRGRRVYGTLGRANEKLVTDSLVRQVLEPGKRLQVLFLGIKLGIPGSQEELVVALMNHGDKQMAEDFLNSGAETLYEGGKTWAYGHGYSVATGMGSHRASWGRF